MMSLLKGAMAAVLAAALLAFGMGFVGFAASVHRAEPQEPLPEADAIVALTGGSLDRLATGMRLLTEGRGRRLLISGVNPQVSDEELIRVLDAPPQLFACCVDVGRLAEDTLGNAAESAAWARRNGFDQIILVTDDYHMPRSLAELQIAMPNAKITPYPIRTRIAEPNAWQTSLRTAGLLCEEYVKLLVIRAREGLLAIDRREEPSEPTA